MTRIILVASSVPEPDTVLSGTACQVGLMTLAAGESIPCNRFTQSVVHLPKIWIDPQYLVSRKAIDG